MAKKINEYDYLYISARIHAMENRLLTRERMERMLGAHSVDDAAKVLSECGYGEFASLTPASIEHTLDQARLELFAELRRSVPDPSIVDVFCIKYDYHNAKVLLKAEATGQRPDELFLDAGRYPAAALQEDYLKGDLSRYSETFRAAVAEAKDTMASSGDPQAADFVLDRAYYAEMLRAAEAARSQFLLGYVRLSIDSANLRSAVRSARMGKGADFLRRALIPGGNVSLDSITAAVTGRGGLRRRSGQGGRPHRLRAALRQRPHRLSHPGKAGGLRRAPPDRLSVRQRERAHHHPHHPHRPAGRAGFGYHPGKAA